MNTQVKKLLRGKKACSPGSHLWLKKKNGSMTKGVVKIGQVNMVRCIGVVWMMAVRSLSFTKKYDNLD